MVMKDRIVLYGTGMFAEKFYYKFREQFSIEYCIDQRKRKTFHGLEVFKPEEKSCDLKTKKVIVAVAGDKQYNAIRKTLIKMGLKEFEDFLWSYELGKKIAILYGNCHFAVLKEYLIRTPSFALEYTIRFKSVYDKEGDDFYRVPSETELRNCSLLIMQDIRNENSHQLLSVTEIKEMAPDCCKIVVVPNLYGYNLFFPQFLKSPSNEPRVASECHVAEISGNENEEGKRIANIAWEVGFMINSDENIAFVHNKKLSIEHVISFMEDDNYYDHDDIRNNFDEQIRKIKERESFCDIIISDYLIETLHDKQMFYDPQHPCEHVICEKGRRILLRLGLVPLPECVISPILNDTELFIYESVRQALNLNYRQDYIRIGADHASLQHGCLSREEYVKDVLSWTYGNNPSDYMCETKSGNDLFQLV